ncbi:protein NLRC3-like [Boleophthalmus pectinirostris]|uniref:protein NLRC3-like n=1 Tax=Boleophthalmus pectinirostris TaxID=150288 RepID=UPI00242D0E12|nr:protein NLRC3-like [Boleophthalmus pectinirostris]
MKSTLTQKFKFLTENIRGTTEKMEFDEGFIELCITVGDSGQNHQEHEVLHMETQSRRAADETTVPCQDMFKPRPHSPQPIRLVLTKGVAGVGKTVLTQKLSLDWAEGRAHQDLQLLFPFTFRDLNVLRDTQFSLVELLHHFFSPSKDLCSFQQLQVLFIFDGLDECRLPLDFGRTRVLSDPTESASVHVLLVNLIRGSLLPSALLWITTRPAAANQIPAECVSMVTEVRGFADPQKEQYFRKRFRDQATVVISHIKSVRSLHIMSHIPIFCWILSKVLQKLLEQTEPELPRTLTQMYVHFLVVQAKVQNIKYQQGSGEDLHWTPETREMVKSLGKVAFEQLQKGNLIFYESDLSECGLDAAAASVYSGVFTQVFREEPGLYQDKVYCFIHLSVQEFLAALHVHLTFYSSGENLLETPHSSESPDPEAFYRSAVDQALQSPNGHLDLFLRFLLGLSLPTNQNLLQGLVIQTKGDRTNQNLFHRLLSWNNKKQKTHEFIKQKLDEEGLSEEKSLNLLHCLNEMNHHSLVEETQKNMREEPVEKTSNKETLDGAELRKLSDLRKYSCDVSLDPNSAHRRLRMSDHHRTVTLVKMNEKQKYPDHEDRFTGFNYQVLSCTGLRGRCYWEVNWSGMVEISVSYRKIKRNTKESWFGNNDHSWSLWIYNDGRYSVRHNCIMTRLTDSCHSERGGVSSGEGGVSSGRVGVFLDSEAGALSFYQISSDEELFHIHTFSSSFSEPLIPGFRLWFPGSSVTLVDLSSS